MACNLTVCASVVDISTDSPKDTDRLLVDTNVWCWITYTRGTHGMNLRRQQRVQAYPAYLKKVKAASGQLLRCGLSFAELAHLIERTEGMIYNGSREFDLKEFRHNYPTERSNVVSEINIAWGQVKSLADPIDLMLDDTLIDAAGTSVLKHRVDGYDLLALEAMSSAGILQVLTDDGDFSTVPGIQMFTANPAVIAAAKSCGKLLIR